MIRTCNKEKKTDRFVTMLGAGQSERKVISEDFAAKIRDQICAGINRRDDEVLKNVFERTIRKSGSPALSTELFTSALEELGLHLKEDEIKALFHTVDVNNDGVMDFEEFKRAVQYPSAIEQLISTLHINKIFADAFMVPDIMGDEPLRQFGQISSEQIKEICKAAIPFLETALTEAKEKIRVSYEAMDKSEASKRGKKFEVPPEMSAGTVEDFHRGLSGRVGLFCSFPLAKLPSSFLLSLLCFNGTSL
jgi:Ca2+-binding EF-hand superfamily protein